MTPTCDGSSTGSKGGEDAPAKLGKAVKELRGGGSAGASWKSRGSESLRAFNLPPKLW
eukprot:CAMPEP_0185275492 /NCGR_PEP_ID=MMETSP1359-20130426/54071_1 /TAXON_ID=552665 /ORGANISM="Bigelowiella longifila, Strain CCMP242" /LENGTH=57 /DNA_ID=CAMNT_0027868851 /DNA_START=799 /DNA_END=969 /DNA_ORIENTATION=-